MDLFYPELSLFSAHIRVPRRFRPVLLSTHPDGSHPPARPVDYLGTGPAREWRHAGLLASWMRIFPRENGFPARRVVRPHLDSTFGQGAARLRPPGALPGYRPFWLPAEPGPLPRSRRRA